MPGRRRTPFHQWFGGARDQVDRGRRGLRPRADREDVQLGHRGETEFCALSESVTYQIPRKNKQQHKTAGEESSHAFSSTGVLGAESREAAVLRLGCEEHVTDLVDLPLLHDVYATREKRVPLPPVVRQALITFLHDIQCRRDVPEHVDVTDHIKEGHLGLLAGQPDDFGSKSPCRAAQDSG